jgi:signal transduction histidine kinase/ligand-binding sensor domain-containing protein/DNA-binding response OmpR family regulator
MRTIFYRAIIPVAASVLLSVCWLVPGGLYAQDYAQPIHFDNYALESGLSNSRVRAFCQDRRGFVWVGTAAGLNRFDAYRFRVFQHRPDDVHGLLHNSVLALLEDSHGHFWVGTKKGLQHFDWRSERFSAYGQEATDFGEVLALSEDSQGAVWVATINGLHRIAPPSGTEAKERALPEQRAIRSFRAGTGPEALPTDRVWCLKEDAAHRLWIGTNAGLRCYSLDQQRFLAFPLPSSLSSLRNAVIHDLEIDRHGNLWAGTEAGLFRMATDGQSGQAYRANSGKSGALQNDFITELEIDAKGSLWIGTNGGGLAVWDAAAERFVHHQYRAFDGGALPSNNVEALFVDRSGGIWAGTHDGISYCHPDAKPFQVFQPTGAAGSIGRGTVQGLCVSADGQLWAGIDGAGLGVYRAGQWSHYRKGQSPALPADDVTAVLEDRTGRIWVAAWTGGLSVLDRSANTIRPVAQELLKDRAVWALFEDAKGRIWIGTANFGPVRYDPATASFRAFPDALDRKGGMGKWAIAFAQDEEGRIWVSTSNGLYRYREVEQTFEHFPVQGLTRQDFIHALHPSGQGGWWLGTQYGLLHLDLASGRVRKWNKSQGLADDWVLSIAEDRKGNLWLGTARGLSKFEPRTEVFNSYFKLGDLRSFECSRAVAQSSQGRLFFGTTQGLIAFHPDSIRTYREAPPAAFTDFRLFNQSVPIRGSAADTLPTASPLTVGIETAEKITLAYWQHSFSFAFTALNYLDPSQNAFRYQLEGYQDHWVAATAQERFAYYTNIPPGKYRFKVLAANNDGVWNEVPAAVEIHIRPPWWRTLWAYLAYLVLAAGAGYALYRFFRWRWLLRAQLQFERQEALRLKTLDDFKNRLYTNLTHEFRTPLTVILGLADQIDQPSGIREVLRRNAKGLLRLVNQILDLAKLEAGQLKLDLALTDIVPYMQYLTESYQSYAAGKQINLVAYMETERLLMDIDEEKLHSVVANLLSNAIKFTPQGGKVILHLREEGGALLLKVRDNGIGIAAGQLPLIFDRFYQVDGTATRAAEGTGLGLALTKELVELMGGQISVSSQEGKGTEFTVALPITRQAPPAQEHLTGPGAPTPLPDRPMAQSVRRPAGGSTGLPQLLLIEDNEDVAFYIQSCLEGRFALTLAPNGALGIAEALESIPDLIISDVMMPEKDGFELCDTLKHDERTSHIPIILLTAKADAASKISGLRRGADAYLTKPFDKEELLVRLEMLLERQKRMAAYFAQPGAAGLPVDEPALEAPLAPEIIAVEDAFLQKVRAIVKEHYADEDFALPQLCQKVGMSRSQLFRKMKALIDESPSDFIRNYRLNEAKRLLETTDLNISEVAWAVGYKDVSHFSKSFQEAFGMLPSATSK